MRLPRLLAVLALAYALALQAMLAGMAAVPAAAAEGAGSSLGLVWCTPGGADATTGDEAPAAHHDLHCILTCGQLTPGSALVPAAVPTAIPVARPAHDRPALPPAEPLSRRDLSRLKPAPRAPPVI